MEVVLSILLGGVFGAVILLAWLAWLGRDAKAEEQRQQEMENIERRLTERGQTARAPEAKPRTD